MKIKLLAVALLWSIVIFVGAFLKACNASAQQNPIQIDANGLTETLTSGGLVVRGQIVKVNSAGQVVPVLTTDTSGAIGVAATSQQNQGQSVTVSIAGMVLVQIDSGGCAAGNFVLISSLTGGAGKCSATSSGQQIGIAVSVSSPGSIFWNVQMSPLSAGGSGGISSVSALPASCTSASAPVLLVVGGVNYGTFVCDPNGGNVWIPENPNQTISPYAYGAVGHVRYTYNASWANASSTVSCSNGECNFQCPGGVYPCTSSTSGCPGLTCDAGKIVKGANMFPQVNANALAAGAGVSVPQGTISTVTNSTTITVSTTTTSACPTGVFTTCTLSWGIQDDTTAIKNAEAAAWGNHSRCIALQLPADNFYITPPILNGPQATLKAGDVCSTLAAANGGSDLTNTGPSVYGAGEGTTTLIMLGVTYANCTFGSGASCMGTMPNLQAHDFQITGLGDIGSGSHGVTLWETIGSNAGGGCDGGTTLQNMNFNNFGLFLAGGSFGVRFGANSCADAVVSNVSVVMFGSTQCVAVAQQPIAVYSLYCAGGGTGSGEVLNISGAAGTQLDTYGSEFVCILSNGGQIVNISGGVKWNSNGDLFRMGDAQCPAAGSLILNNASQVDLNEDSVTMGTSQASGAAGYNAANTGAILHSTNTIWNGNANAGSTLFTTGATDKVFFDGSGNKITNAGNANTFSGPVFGITNTAVGTACVIGNFALTSGWGTSALGTVTANGNIQGCHMSITGAAGAAGPVLTWTYPVAPIIAPASCHLSGASGTLTGVSTGTPGATSVAYTFTGTPSAQTYVFDVGCP